LKILEKQCSAVKSKGDRAVGELSLKQRIEYKKNLKNQFEQSESPQQPIGELDRLFSTANKTFNINRNTTVKPKKSVGSELEAGSE
jgi:hypothetical protein